MLYFEEKENVKRRLYVDIFWLLMGGGPLFGWWWVVVDIFWVVVHIFCLVVGSGGR